MNKKMTSWAGKLTDFLFIFFWGLFDEVIHGFVLKTIARIFCITLSTDYFFKMYNIVSDFVSSSLATVVSVDVVLVPPCLKALIQSLRFAFI